MDTGDIFAFYYSFELISENNAGKSSENRTGRTGLKLKIGLVE